MKNSRQEAYLYLSLKHFYIRYLRNIRLRGSKNHLFNLPIAGKNQIKACECTNIFFNLLLSCLSFSMYIISKIFVFVKNFLNLMVGRDGFEPPNPKEEVYSLPRLAASLSTHIKKQKLLIPSLLLWMRPCGGWCSVSSFNIF